MRKLNRQEITQLGVYDFLGYIGAFDSPYIGGIDGTLKMIDHLNIQRREDFRVLEVGCASGFTSCLVASEYDCHVTGIDLSDILILKAQERADKLGLTNTDFQVADATKLPFDDNSFDALFGVALTGLIPMKDELFQEFMRVLKPGGSIGTLDLFAKEDADPEVVDRLGGTMKTLLEYDVTILDIQQWKTIFENTGFFEIEVEENYNDVLLNTRKRSGTVKATMKLLYHMLINGSVRKRMMKLMKLRKTVISKTDGGFEYLGYLVFTGRKPIQSNSTST